MLNVCHKEAGASLTTRMDCQPVQKQSWSSQGSISVSWGEFELFHGRAAVIPTEVCVQNTQRQPEIIPCFGNVLGMGQTVLWSVQIWQGWEAPSSQRAQAEGCGML